MAVVGSETDLVDGLHGHVRVVTIGRQPANHGVMLPAFDGDAGEMFHEESSAKT